MGKNHVGQIGRRIRDFRKSLTQLASNRSWAEQLRLLRFPGYTTPAEFKLILGILEEMEAQARALDGLREVLIAASRQIVEAGQSR
jgi:hypothetical protein